jgi:hypothetical protein
MQAIPVSSHRIVLNRRHNMVSSKTLLFQQGRTAWHSLYMLQHVKQCPCVLCATMPVVEQLVPQTMLAFVIKVCFNELALFQTNIGNEASN